MGTDTERNPKNGNSFNSVPLRVRILNTDTEVKIQSGLHLANLHSENFAYSEQARA